MGKTQSDDHGEYDPDAGSPHPVDSDDVPYEPCNAVLKYTFQRYGERRYCTGMAVSNFGEAANYDEPQFCKHHQARAALMKQQADSYKTGAYAKSHQHQFQHMPPHKKVIANDLYQSLLKESSYDFEVEDTELEIDVSETDFAGPEVDALVLSHPIPTEHQQRGKALWFAALDFIVMEEIREEQFRVAATETDREGQPLTPGEKMFEKETESGHVIEVKDEHHLNLAHSRIQKDYKEHLKFGGVQIDGETDSANMGEREWVAVVEPEPAPEADSGEEPAVASIEMPDDD